MRLWFQPNTVALRDLAMVRRDFQDGRHGKRTNFGGFQVKPGIILSYSQVPPDVILPQRWTPKILSISRRPSLEMPKALLLRFRITHCRLRAACSKAAPKAPPT